MDDKEREILNQLIAHIGALQGTVTQLTVIVGITSESVLALVDILEAHGGARDPSSPIARPIREAFLKARKERTDEFLISLENSDPASAAKIRAWIDGEASNLDG